MRGYDRTDRLNELLTRILAEELEIIDDEVLGFITVTGVQTDKSLTQAKVLLQVSLMMRRCVVDLNSIGHGCRG